MGKGFGFVQSGGKSRPKLTGHTLLVGVSRVLDNEALDELRKEVERLFSLAPNQFQETRTLADDAGSNSAPSSPALPVAPAIVLVYTGWQGDSGPWSANARDRWQDLVLALKPWMARQIESGKPVRRLFVGAVEGSGGRRVQKSLSLLERQEDGIHLVDVTPAIQHTLRYMGEAFLQVLG